MGCGSSRPGKVSAATSAEAQDGQLVSTVSASTIEEGGQVSQGNHIGIGSEAAPGNRLKIRTVGLPGDGVGEGAYGAEAAGLKDGSCVKKVGDDQHVGGRPIAPDPDPRDANRNQDDRTPNFNNAARIQDLAHNLRNEPDGNGQQLTLQLESCSPPANGDACRPSETAPAPSTSETEEGKKDTGGEEMEEEEEEPPFGPFIKLIKDGGKGDEIYRKARIRSRNEEPCKPPKLNPAEEEALRAVWQSEWFSFPTWSIVLLTRAAVGRKLWRAMSNDRRRAACERFMLCGPWAASQEPDEETLAALRATSSSARFVMLQHPARREFFLGAFVTGHGLARVDMLKSDRPYDPGTWDMHGVTRQGDIMTTAEVCNKIIVPATRAFGAAYVDLYLAETLWGTEKAQQEASDASGSSDSMRFLSHAWGMPFMQLVTIAITESSPPQHSPGPYWIDIFCKNQHVPIKESDLTDNILGSKGVVLAVWPWPAPLLTTRVWCLFEILNAVKTQVKLELKLCEGASLKFRTVLKSKYNDFTYSKLREDVRQKGLSYVLPGADELIQAVDVRQATATVPADKDMILRLIEQDLGSEDMNKLVREMLVEGLASAAQGVVESMVGEDRLSYYSYGY